MAMQADVARQLTALRRALRSPHTVTRVSLTAIALLAVLMFWITLGATLTSGALPPAFATTWPALGNASPVMAAFGLFVIGVGVLSLLAWLAALAAHAVASLRRA
jgi:hypothetical protein